jgi:solute carrier family 10 (sodium/bile acid cotransporter), member 7
LLAGFLLSTHGGFSVSALADIAVQLLLPFMAGQLARPWIGAWIARHRSVIGLVDRGSILLVVYAAFSDGVTHGIWHQVDAAQLATLLAVDAALLVAVLGLTTLASRVLGFSRADEIAIVFCGSKKSLASGLPMATVLLAGQPVGLIVLPLMLFHQVQLMACAALAKRYAGTARPAAQVSGALAEAH